MKTQVDSKLKNKKRMNKKVTAKDQGKLEMSGNGSEPALIHEEEQRMKTQVDSKVKNKKRMNKKVTAKEQGKLEMSGNEGEKDQGELEISGNGYEKDLSELERLVSECEKDQGELEMSGNEGENEKEILTALLAELSIANKELSILNDNAKIFHTTYQEMTGPSHRQSPYEMIAIRVDGLFKHWLYFETVEKMEKIKNRIMELEQSIEVARKELSVSETCSV